jgi:hypothetical protein
MAKRKKAASKKCCAKWDKWAFNLSWILAIILALGGALGGAWVTMPFWSLILVILGLIVGFTYKTKEMTPLVLIAIGLAIFGGSSITVIPYIGSFVSNAIAYFIAFLTPATLVVVLRRTFEILG